jgi:hypothetical protein
MSHWHREAKHKAYPFMSMLEHGVLTALGSENAVYSFCTILMCCRRTAGAGWRNLRSASSRYFAASVIKYSVTLGLVHSLAMHRSASCRWSSSQRQLFPACSFMFGRGRTPTTYLPRPIPCSHPSSQPSARFLEPQKKPCPKRGPRPVLGQDGVSGTPTAFSEVYESSAWETLRSRQRFLSGA